MATLTMSMKLVEVWQGSQETSGLSVVGPELAHFQADEDRSGPTEEGADEPVFPEARAQRVLDRPKDAEPLAQIDQPSGQADVPGGALSITRRESAVSCDTACRTWRSEVYPPNSAIADHSRIQASRTWTVFQECKS